MKATAALILGITLLGAGHTNGNDLEAILRNWRKVRAEDVLELSKSDIAKLRSRARETHSSDARVPLLRAGDAEVTQLCVDDFCSGQWSRTVSAADQLALSGEPRLIALLGEELNRNESTKRIRPGAANEVEPDVSISPVSVRVGKVIRLIIARSNAFGEEVKAWAAALEQNSKRDEVRENMPLWWRQNQGFLEAGNYGLVQPPK